MRYNDENCQLFDSVVRRGYVYGRCGNNTRSRSLNRRIWWGGLALLIATAVVSHNITIPGTAREFMDVVRPHGPIETVSDQIRRKSIWYKETLGRYDACLAKRSSCDRRMFEAELDRHAADAWISVFRSLNSGDVAWRTSPRSSREQDFYTAALSVHGEDLARCTPRFSYWLGAGPTVEPRLEGFDCRPLKSAARTL
jgi:hypothetical protein